MYTFVRGIAMATTGIRPLTEFNSTDSSAPECELSEHAILVHLGHLVWSTGQAW